MSLAQSKTALGLAVIFVAAAAVRGTAQTPSAAANSPAIATTKAAPITDVKKGDDEKASIAASEKNKSEKTSETSGGPRDSAADTAGNSSTANVAGPNPQATSADEWQFQLTPYFWLAGLHGTTGTANRTVVLDHSFGDIFDVLNFALMGVFEARKGKISVITDMEYVSLEDEAATPGPFFSTATAKVKTFIFNPEVGYRVFEDPDKGHFVDVVGGIRVWRISTDFTFGPGILPGTQIEASRTWVDGVGGLRGKAALAEKLFFTGQFDLGGGGSDFTWHLFAGLGYNITPKIALIGGYRVLDVKYNKDNFVYDTNQRGPIFGAGFRF